MPGIVDTQINKIWTLPRQNLQSSEVDREKRMWSVL